MPHRGPIRPFTPRQNEIAELVAAGFSYAQIGHRLGIKPSRVRNAIRDMALLFDAYGDFNDGELAPRQIVLVYAIERRIRHENGLATPAHGVLAHA